MADNYDDLGDEVEADMCCREHDHCPDLIAGGDTKYNLTNTAFYTRYFYILVFYVYYRDNTALVSKNSTSE